MGVAIVHSGRAPGNPAALSCFPNRAGLGLLAVVCLVLHSTGCAHQPADHGPVPQKPHAIEKQAPPAATQQPRIEQPDKAKTAEKKSREKKPVASPDKASDTKPEQPTESSTDTFVPPPPQRPPSFGGAGG